LVQQSRFERLGQWNQTPSPTGNPDARGSTREDGIAWICAECGISINW
jgi:hypothetical protein